MHTSSSPGPHRAPHHATAGVHSELPHFPLCTPKGCNPHAMPRTQTEGAPYAPQPHTAPALQRFPIAQAWPHTAQQPLFQGEQLNHSVLGAASMGPCLQPELLACKQSLLSRHPSLIPSLFCSNNHENNLQRICGPKGVPGTPAAHPSAGSTEPLESCEIQGSCRKEGGGRTPSSPMHGALHGKLCCCWWCSAPLPSPTLGAHLPLCIEPTGCQGVRVGQLQVSALFFSPQMQRGVPGMWNASHQAFSKAIVALLHCCKRRSPQRNRALLPLLPSQAMHGAERCRSTLWREENMQGSTSELHSTALILIASLGEASFGGTSSVILTPESLEKELPFHETSRPAFNRELKPSPPGAVMSWPRGEQKGAAPSLQLSCE